MRTSTDRAKRDKTVTTRHSQIRSQRRPALATLRSGAAVLVAALASIGCRSDGGDLRDPASTYFPTMSVVFGEEGQNTYMSLLRSLDEQEIDYEAAREFAGWADLWVQGDKAFVTDGEAPALTRYSVGTNGMLSQDGRLSFASYGSDSAAFSRNVIVSPTKAYLFVMAERQVVVWNPEALEITSTFELPALEDRGAQRPYVTTDRGAVVRGDHLYVTVGWGDWENYSLSNDSAILVIDTASDRVQDTLPIACPDLNVATIDDRGDVYFSNWVYGIGPALFEGGSHTCAVRIRADADVVDDDWSLKFADVTEGREAAALRFLGDGKALVSVFHREEVDITPESDRYAMVDGQHWRFWTVDLDTREAEPVAGVDWHAGGYYSERIDERNMLFVPSADYSSTAALELFSDGTIEPRWKATGWVTRLFKLELR
jgi:hypothetical protein